MPISVRISAATFEADLDAVIRPGVSTILYPHAESASQIQQADAIMMQLERFRGIRPRTVEIGVMVESARGVCALREIAASSSRIASVGTGPHLDLGGDGLAYAQGECELVTRSLELRTFNIHNLPD